MNILKNCFYEISSSEKKYNTWRKKPFIFYFNVNMIATKAMIADLSGGIYTYCLSV